MIHWLKQLFKKPKVIEVIEDIKLEDLEIGDIVTYLDGSKLVFGRPNGDYWDSNMYSLSDLKDPIPYREIQSQVRSIDTSQRKRMANKLERAQRMRFGGARFGIESTDRGYYLWIREPSLGVKIPYTSDGFSHLGYGAVYSDDPLELEAILQGLILEEGIKKFKAMKHQKLSYRLFGGPNV